MDEEDEEETVEDEGEQIPPEDLLKRCHEELENRKQEAIDAGVHFTDEEFAALKYETNDVKLLKTLTVICYHQTFIIYSKIMHQHF